MELALQTCKICQSVENIGVNYGVLSCNACKMFFHRAIFSKHNIKGCRGFGECTLNCRPCRFKRCIQHGMFYVPTENLLKEDNQKLLTALIFNLSHMENHRNYQLYNCWLPGDPSISELAWSINQFKLVPRTETVKMDFMEWGYHSAIVSIEHLSKFPFINNLDVEDRIIVLKHCYFYSSLLFDSLRATQQKDDFICFPDRTEVVLLNAPGVSKPFENSIRSRLAGRANQLKITRDEVLLLSVLLLCNPGLPNLSHDAQSKLAEYQRIFSSALLQHCLKNHQKDGPSRFADLISLFHVLVKTCQDLIHHFVISNIPEEGVKLRRIFSED